MTETRQMRALIHIFSQEERLPGVPGTIEGGRNEFDSGITIDFFWHLQQRVWDAEKNIFERHFLTRLLLLWTIDAK